MSAIFSWLMEGAKRFHYFDLDACAPQKLKRGSLANWNLLVDMIYRDISNHQLQSGGIFETPHVKPRSFVSQERLDQSEQNEGIFVDLWIPEFLPVQWAHVKECMNRTKCSHMKLVQAQAAINTMGTRWPRNLRMIMVLWNSPLSSIRKSNDTNKKHQKTPSAPHRRPQNMYLPSWDQVSCSCGYLRSFSEN